MRRFLSLVTLCLITLSHSWLVSAKNNPVIIFSAEQASQVIAPNEPPFWTPTAKQIVLLESLLASHLKSKPPRNGKPVLKPLEYSRQYIGVTKNGHKLIYLNAFCSQIKGWHERFVMVLDGGSCYFQVYFDLAGQKFSELQYNGNA